MTMTKSLSIRLHQLLKSEFEHSSKNLAVFAKRRDYMKNHYRVLRHDGILYIAMKDDNGLICGAKLLRVACGKFDTWAFSGISDAKDVTEWFIDEYKEKGVCAYSDGWSHVWDAEYEEEGNIKRKCKYCGHTETQHSKMVEKVWWE